MSEQHDNSEERLRRLLRDLPRVRAKPDFEQRLARRRTEEASRPTGLFAWLTDSRRIPAPVYSAAALVIVAVVAYYAFFRSGVVPSPPVSTGEPTPKSAPAVEQMPDRNTKDDRSGESIDNTQSPSRERKIDEPRSESPPQGATRGDGRVAPSSHPPPGEVRKSKVMESPPVQAPAEVKREQELTGAPAPELKQVAEPARESVRLPETPMNVPSMNVAPGQKAFTPQTLTKSARTSGYSVTAESFMVAPDSARLKDSIRADSLRKAKLDSLKRK